jgi:hypothetical protein
MNENRRAVLESDHPAGAEGRLGVGRAFGGGDVGGTTSPLAGGSEGGSEASGVVGSDGRPEPGLDGSAGAQLQGLGPDPAGRGLLPAHGDHIAGRAGREDPAAGTPLGGTDTPLDFSQ